MFSAELLPTVLEKTTRIALIGLGSLLVYQALAWLVSRYENLAVKKAAGATPEAVALRKRVETSAAILRQLLKYATLGGALYLILGEVIEWRRFVAIVTGVGIVGVIIAFSAQALVKDLIAGLFILVEGQYGVGDVVHLHVTGYEVFGVVEELGLRTTVVRDLSGNARFVPNGSIIGVHRYAQGFLRFVIDILLPPRTAREAVESAVTRASLAFEANPFLLRAPATETYLDRGEQGTLLAVSIHVVPSQEWVAEKLAEACSHELQEALSLPEPPTYATYPVNERSIKRYRRSIVL